MDRGLNALMALAAIHPSIKKALEEAERKVRWWKTEVMIRAVEAPTGLEASNNCAWCKGGGLAHFCVRADEHGGVADDECFHPNEEEVRKLRLLQVQLVKTLLVEMLGKPDKLPRMPAVKPEDLRLDPDEQIALRERLRSYGVGAVRAPATVSVVDTEEDHGRK